MAAGRAGGMGTLPWRDMPTRLQPIWHAHNRGEERCSVEASTKGLKPRGRAYCWHGRGATGRRRASLLLRRALLPHGIPQCHFIPAKNASPRTHACSIAPRVLRLLLVTSATACALFLLASRLRSVVAAHHWSYAAESHLALTRLCHSHGGASARHELTA